MIRIYRAPWSTNCERIALALAHKGLEAESVMIEYADRGPVEEVSGQPLVPVIDDEGEASPCPRSRWRMIATESLTTFVEWFNEVYKAAPNSIEAELETGTPNLAVLDELERRIDAHLKYAAGRPEEDDELFHVILDDNQSVEGRPSLAAWIERVGERPVAFGPTA